MLVVRLMYYFFVKILAKKDRAAEFYLGYNCFYLYL